ncbi:MAG: MFS transporter [Deltaproteobacteria bacterium]|nr:MAG: MFS transporter [Deltaproteobacteria bacterium]
MSPDADARSTGYARYTLALLAVLNFLNYADRYVLGAVLEPVRAEFGLSGTEAGLLGSVFMVVYMCVAPLTGYLGDRARRTRIVALCALAWSLATAATALAGSYAQLLVLRALVGVGEAGYAAIAPSLVADRFTPDRRGRALAWFYLAIPVGSALGFVVGGLVAAAWGFRAAFVVAGAPGLVLAALAWRLPEPPRGALDSAALRPAEPLSPRATWQRLVRTPAWVVNTAATALMTFTMGGLAFWMPAFLQRTYDLAVDQANLMFGGATVAAGLLGTFVGGYLGDLRQRNDPAGYFVVSGWGLLVGAPCVLALPLLAGPEAVVALSFVAEFFLFLNTSPLNAALVASVPAHLRASGFAINIFLIHAFGDAVSPTWIGWVSDRVGLGVGLATMAVPVAIGGMLLVASARWVRRWPGGLAHVRP